jgi:hypothetical protein
LHKDLLVWRLPAPSGTVCNPSPGTPADDKRFLLDLSFYMVERDR